MQNLEMPNSPRFLKVTELAELLKVKPRTIYEMVAQDAFLIESRTAQTFFVLISMKFLLGPKAARGNEHARRQRHDEKLTLIHLTML